MYRSKSANDIPLNSNTGTETGTRTPIEISEDHSPSYYELDASDEQMIENLSDKMHRIRLPRITVCKTNITEESKSPVITVPNTGDSYDDIVTEKRKVSNSPDSRQHYDRRSVDESYARGNMKIPRSSPTHSPSKRVCEYPATRDQFRGEEFDSFGPGDKTKSTPGPDTARDLNTPSTKADTVIRSNSWLSCTNKHVSGNEKVLTKKKHNSRRVNTQSKLPLHSLS